MNTGRFPMGDYWTFNGINFAWDNSYDPTSPLFGSLTGSEEATDWIDRHQSTMQDLELIGGPGAIRYVIENKARHQLPVPVEPPVGFCQ